MRPDSVGLKADGPVLHGGTTPCGYDLNAPAGLTECRVDCADVDWSSARNLVNENVRGRKRYRKSEAPDSRKAAICISLIASSC